ncbi:MAG: Hpt domain-containing protein [Selenomonadaceae bacterium]|nr:Hpt domain-containing protein [Selenomonadaceae bacterium]
MLTIEQLEEFGVNTKEGLTRCMNNQTFYFKMLKMGLANDSFEKLESAVTAGNLEDAFESAHALKGVLGNLAITPLYTPIAEITEMLRARRAADYVEIYKPVLELRNKLLALV